MSIDYIAKLKKIKAKIKNYIITHEEWFDDIYQLESCLIGIEDLFDKEFAEMEEHDDNTN